MERRRRACCASTSRTSSRQRGSRPGPSGVARARPPIELVGYSNGAALAVSYALDALEDDSLPRPAHLVLISPAIGITRLAALGRIRTGLSEIHGFGRAAWQLVEPELDPFKYQSFPWHAAGVTQRLTSTLRPAHRAAGRRLAPCGACRRSLRSCRRWTRRCTPPRWSTRCWASSRRKGTSWCCSTSTDSPSCSRCWSTTPRR